MSPNDAAGAPAAIADVDAQALAERVRDAMVARDAVARLLDLRIDAVGPGSSRVSMQVRAEMLNGFDICHGGMIATLADTAFAYACNAANHLTVASGFDIDLLAPAHAGDRLQASCSVIVQGARVGLYDVDVRNQRGERVAVFRGRAHRRHGQPVTG